MAMNIGSSNSTSEPEMMIDINTTPLIDVMLVLLIMLIITIPIQTHAVKLNMPVSNHQLTVPPPVVSVDIDFDGTILWNGQVVNGRDDLDTRLREVAAMADQAELHIRPNRLVKYKTVAMVMASAQRLGVTKIGLIGNEQYLI